MEIDKLTGILNAINNKLMIIKCGKKRYRQVITIMDVMLVFFNDPALNNLIKYLKNI